MRRFVLSTLALAACGPAAGTAGPPDAPESAAAAANQPGAPSHPQTTEEEASRGEVVDFTRGWEGWDDDTIGCRRFGGVVRLRGRLEVVPFGKKSEGTKLVLEGGDELIVAYGQTEQHHELRGVPVIATGRYCDKQLQAVTGQHFHIETLTVPERPAGGTGH